MTKVTELDAANFDTVTGGNGFSIVYFGSRHCVPCKTLKPVFYEAAEEFDGDVIFAAVNTDDNGDIAVRRRITMLPTVCLFKSGEVIGRFVGARKKADIFNFIEKHTK